MRGDLETLSMSRRFNQTNFNHLMNEPGASQVSTKGILAVAGACCGGAAAPVVHRGPARDNGAFFDYRKTFLRLGIEAVIEFTGTGFQENLTVALKQLYFLRNNVQDGYSPIARIPLGGLPRVLLAECWNDIRITAADGPGFAPDWKNQAGV